MFWILIIVKKGDHRSVEQEKKQHMQEQHDGKGDQLLAQIDQAQGFIIFFRWPDLSENERRKNTRIGVMYIMMLLISLLPEVTSRRFPSHKTS